MIRRFHPSICARSSTATTVLFSSSSCSSYRSFTQICDREVQFDRSVHPAAENAYDRFAQEHGLASAHDFYRGATQAHYSLASMLYRRRHPLSPSAPVTSAEKLLNAKLNSEKKNQLYVKDKDENQNNNNNNEKNINDTIDSLKEKLDKTDQEDLLATLDTASKYSKSKFGHQRAPSPDAVQCGWIQLYELDEVDRMNSLRQSFSDNNNKEKDNKDNNNSDVKNNKKDQDQDHEKEDDNNNNTNKNDNEDDKNNNKTPTIKNLTTTADKALKLVRLLIAPILRVSFYQLLLKPQEPRTTANRTYLAMARPDEIIDAMQISSFELIPKQEEDETQVQQNQQQKEEDEKEQKQSETEKSETSSAKKTESSSDASAAENKEEKEQKQEEETEKTGEQFDRFKQAILGSKGTLDKMEAEDNKKKKEENYSVNLKQKRLETMTKQYDIDVMVACLVRVPPGRYCHNYQFFRNHMKTEGVEEQFGGSKVSADAAADSVARVLAVSNVYNIFRGLDWFSRHFFKTPLHLDPRALPLHMLGLSEEFPTQPTRYVKYYSFQYCSETKHWRLVGIDLKGHYLRDFNKDAWEAEQGFSP